jgi:hypothetical protein
MPKKPSLKEVTAEFGKAHAEEAAAKGRMEKYRKQFFDLLKAAIPKTELARQTIYYEGEDPDIHIATLYPKWEIIKANVIDGNPPEWSLVIEEDPERKSWQYLNPEDGQVYRRTVKESAPQVDLERIEKEDPDLYFSLTFQPTAPREMLPLDLIPDEIKEKLMEYLLPPKLTNVMEKPRKAKPEELE